MYRNKPEPMGCWDRYSYVCETGYGSEAAE
jgi:hypothetical protein